MEQARKRVIAAHKVLEAGHLGSAVSIAYYAMLNSARAALPEGDNRARIDRGAWHLFRERYVVTGAFDEKLHALATTAQQAREQGDYEAVTPDPAEAKRIVEGASAFTAAVEHMLDA